MIPQDKKQSAIESLKGKKIFLTGGTGFFGKSFLDFILTHAKNLDFQMTILSRDPEGFLKRNPQYRVLKQIDFQKGDIRSLKADSNTRYDTILHFAATADPKLINQNPTEASEAIVTGMKNVLLFAEAAKVQEFLFTSSGAAYGKQKTPLAYADGKKLAESMGLEFSSSSNVGFKIARCFSFIGPQMEKDSSFAIANFIKSAASNNKIIIKGDGTATRSYLYSEDLIVWLLTILSKGENKEIYDVGSEEEISILELAQKVKKVLGSDIEIEVQQKPLANQIIDRYIPDILKAKKLGLLSWTSLDEAIKKTKDF